MSRQPRLNLPDSFYHVTSRGVEKRVIFMDERDKCVFLRYMDEALRGAEASLIAYCLMNNHFHLLLATHTTSLSDVMHLLLTRYSAYFNHVHERVGHLFQGRYHAELCEDQAYLIHLPVYIHRNPVRAKLVATVADWPWSSHQEFAVRQPRHTDHTRLEELADIKPEEFIERYLERVHVGEEPNEPLADVSEILRRLAARHGVEIRSLHEGRRSDAIIRIKKELLSWAKRRGVPDSDLADALGCTQEAVRQFRRRYCHVGA